MIQNTLNESQIFILSPLPSNYKNNFQDLMYFKYMMTNIPEVTTYKIFCLVEGEKPYDVNMSGSTP